MFSVFTTLLLAIGLLTPALAVPIQSTSVSADGFPTPSDAQLLAIEQIAQGTLPNGGLPPPGAVDADGITNFQLINFNENFEVFFFKSLVYNITNNVDGFVLKDQREREFILKSLNAVIAVSLTNPY